MALLSCPFCGCHAIPTPSGGGLCVRCGAEADEWNRRDGCRSDADEIERLRAVLRTIVDRAEDAKRLWDGGHPVSAYNLASGILGQIGEDVMSLK